MFSLCVRNDRTTKLFNSMNNAGDDENVLRFVFVDCHEDSGLTSHVNYNVFQTLLQNAKFVSRKSRERYIVVNVVTYLVITNTWNVDVIKCVTRSSRSNNINGSHEVVNKIWYQCSCTGPHRMCATVTPIR